MSDDLRTLPELNELDPGRLLIRIPPETDVWVTSRVMRLIDTAPFRRLSRISQLGLVALVYPGATHTRFAHSLGVYRLGLLYLKSLGNDEEFRRRVSAREAELFLVAALLHDLGHWPFCHPIEDMRLPSVPRHESLARDLLCNSEIDRCLREDWGLTGEQVADFLAPSSSSPKRLLQSLLSGPIDVDKLDYLDRDSLHAGVPYGRNFDRQRLIQSLCLSSCGSKLAVTSKGRTAAEMMVFARYIMFSEVYWHHAVRSATAMLQRAVYSLQGGPDWIASWTRCEDASMIQSLREATKGTEFEACIDGLFGSRRVLFKRLRQYDCNDVPLLHQALARRPYEALVRCSEELALHLSRDLGENVGGHEVLIDAPPVKLEVQFRVQIRSNQGTFDDLGDVSPVVRALAERQFDDLVKKVRVFISPKWHHAVQHLPIDDYLKDLLG